MDTVVVESDGQKVWVNGPQGCMARFGQISGEVYLPMLESVLKESWAEWTHRVLLQFGVHVPDHTKPHWC